MSDDHVARALADLALDAADASADPIVSASAVRALVDWFAVTVGGTAAPATQALLTAFGGGTGGVRLLGVGERTAAPETAALIHGTAAHALELDDIYSPGLYHPGAPTIAAALASAERFDLSGAAFVRGIVAGIEVGCRVAADLGPEHYRHWHSTGTAGTIGAAVAAAVVRGASREQIAQTIAIAGTMAAGLQQTFRRDGAAKPLHAGHAAQSGVIAAFSALEGLTGAIDVLEGPSGLGIATGGGTGWGASRAPLGDDLCVRHLTVKPYPCCGHTFAAIDAARVIRQRGVRAEDISALTVETYSTAVATAGIALPQKPSEARFSISFTVATALEDGRVTQASFTDERLTEPRIIDLLPRIAVRAHPDFDDVFPARRGARVRVELTDGSSLLAEVPDRLGSPENPISAAALDEKFYDLVFPLLGNERGLRLRAMLSRITTLASVRELTTTSPTVTRGAS